MLHHRSGAVGKGWVKSAPGHGGEHRDKGRSESAFATIRHRSSRAKGCITRQSMLSMIYKMGRCAEQPWRRLRGFRQLAKVIKGVKFNDGIEIIEDSRAAA